MGLGAQDSGSQQEAYGDTYKSRTATNATLALCQFFLIDQIDMVAEPAHSKRSETRKLRNKAYKVSNQSLDRDRDG